MKLEEISNIIENTEREHNEKYGRDQKRKIEVICHVEFIDLLLNKTKRVKINHYRIFYRIHRRIIASNGRFKVNKANILLIMTAGDI